MSVARQIFVEELTENYIRLVTAKMTADEQATNDSNSRILALQDVIKKIFGSSKYLDKEAREKAENIILEVWKDDK